MTNSGKMTDKVEKTDLEKLTAVFTELGVGFEVRENMVVCEKGMSSNVGYNGFSADFEFTPEGKFVQLGVWE
ncbi:hypothetical protein ACOTC5_31270 [Achromobacter xylosoxidans]